MITNLFVKKTHAGASLPAPFGSWALPQEKFLQGPASLPQPSRLLHLKNQNAKICEICLFQAGKENGL